MWRVGGIRESGAWLLLGVLTCSTAGHAAPAESFDAWKARNSQEINQFENYLRQQGVTDIPPFQQLLSTATEWRRCGAQYAVPPLMPSRPGLTEEERYIHWRTAAQTLKLYTELRNKGVIDKDATIVSAYRPSGMATCVNSTKSSPHSTAFAIDVAGSKTTSDALCRFYKSEGRARKLGLSKYNSGRIHLDVTKHRTWGNDCTCETSYCVRCATSRSRKCRQ
jgi:hypothetical protein